MLKEILLISASLLLLSGCSSKESLLVPGQTESDCDEKAKALGVCGTPKAVYEHRDKIKNLWYEEDQAYFVKKNGKIYNVETREEVIPGKKPEGCVYAICPNCDDDINNDPDHVHDETCTGVNEYSSKKKRDNRVLAKNRSMIVDTPQETTMMRDLGWQQKIWIAPMNTRGDDLIEAHGIHVVVRKPRWIIGEEVPKNVKRGIVVPSTIAREVLTDNHEAIDRNVNKNMANYVVEEKFDQLESIIDYVKEQEAHSVEDKK